MLADKLSHVPTKPGVYQLKGEKGRILYIGKAKNLRNRLKTYFQRPESLDARKHSMVSLVRDFSFIITENELEALVLEANLIKQYKPQYNIILRDDKNYPYLKLTMSEQWPRLEVVRRIRKDNALYFGPYVPAQGMWDSLAFIRRNFPIRICKHSLDRPIRPCIQYQMGRCGAPCSGRIDRDEYMKIVDEVILFLRGEGSELLDNLEKKMIMLSDELKFEEAASIRDRISNIKHAWESQRVVAPDLGDIDVIGYSTDGLDAVCEVFFVRNGILVGTKDFYLKDAGRSPKTEVLHSFIEMFYMKEILPPGQIIVGERPCDLGNLKAWLKEKRGGRVAITTPKEGKKLELLHMADENAAQLLSSRKTTGVNEITTKLKERLNLPFCPHTIGAFDVSTVGGSESVGAFIYWSEGEFVKDFYRHLRIREVSGIDDYAMMHELIARTLKDLGDEIPDLIVIDGGKGQLEIAKGVVETGGITTREGKQPMLISVAKDPDRAFTLLSETIDLEDRTPSSLLLKKIRDEVHRFAISYHRKLRDKRLVESPLEKVPGIGKKRRLELLRYFGSIDSIRNAPLEEIVKIKGFNKKVAQTLLHELRRHA
ncbi:MAG TPA: excinuclease ABC subunit C [Nitrospiraceae bacterium]|nr:excinuclease ABC subunit C [Nitrospiraceae bacterium]